MSVLSFVVECDSFQHSLAPFSLRCIAIACGQTRSTYTRLFDTSELLQDKPAAFRKYHFQTQHHGLALAGQELQQSMANSVLIHAINEILLELTEEEIQPHNLPFCGLKCAVETALLTFVQDALLNAFEAGYPVPNSIVLWTKEHDMLTRFSALALQLAPLPLPSLVRNLEDLDCPPVRCLTQLKPAEMPTTVPKALAFAKWLEDQHLA
ncbi:hypothetical protein ACROYT_G031715 [Oculina patagonica]